MEKGGRVGEKGDREREKETKGRREKDSPHKHLKCDTVVLSAHIKAPVQGA